MFTRETASVARRCHRDGETTASHRASAAPDSAQPDMTTFYVRLFLTYVPLLGVKGFLVLFFMVR